METLPDLIDVEYQGGQAKTITPKDGTPSLVRRLPDGDLRSFDEDEEVHIAVGTGLSPSGASEKDDGKEPFSPTFRQLLPKTGPKSPFPAEEGTQKLVHQNVIGPQAHQLDPPRPPPLDDARRLQPSDGQGPDLMVDSGRSGRGAAAHSLPGIQESPQKRAVRRR
jgi:hypothetical protein